MKNEKMEVFLFADCPVRVAGTPDNPLFLAKDLCDVLGSAVRDVRKIVDADEVDSIHTVDSVGRKCEMTAVTESGLYHLIFKSRKAAAKKFRRWVTEEVLPQIRKTGRYAPQKRKLTNRDVLEYALAQELRNEKQAVALGLVEPHDEYGEVSEETGEARTQLVRSYFRTPQLGADHLRGVRFVNLQLELQLELPALPGLEA